MRLAVAAGLAGSLLLQACVSAGGERRETDPSEAARVNTELGAGYIRSGRNAMAREKLERALEFDKRYAPAHATYALLMARMGEDETADRHFRTALRLAPEDPDTRNNYGAWLCSRGQLQAALEQFERAAGVPGYIGRVTALNNAGLCLRDSDPAAAEAYLRRALELNPQNAQTLAQLAWVSYAQGEFLRSRAFLTRQADVGPLDAESLWLAWQTEKALGDEAAASRYRNQLDTKYPDFQAPPLR